MKRSTKTISIIIIFFLIITIVVVGRTMIGNHFKKKFSKIPPPGIIIAEVIEKEFSEKIETFGTAISRESKTFKIKKDDLIGDLKLKKSTNQEFMDLYASSIRLCPLSLIKYSPPNLFTR